MLYNGYMLYDSYITVIYVSQQFYNRYITVI